MPSTTFGYTGSEQTYTVPAGVNYVTVECWGAQGGFGEDNGTRLDGANGGYAKGTLPVTPGETLYVYVGGAGNGTANPSGDMAGGWPNGADGIYAQSDDGRGAVGGSGGGSSDVRRGGNTPSDAVIAAGGGAGSGFIDSQNSGWSSAGAGGAGGGASGEGQDGESVDDLETSGDGGSGGGSGSFFGEEGTAKGDSNAAASGGSGGGGFNGGGGGTRGASSSYASAGGGGGGDGTLVGVSNTTTTIGANTGDGQVVISWSLSTPQNPAAQSLDDASAEVTWDDVDNDDGYEIYRSTSSGVTTSDTLAGTVGQDTTSFTDTGLTSGQTYYYRVRAINGSATSDLSTEVSAKTALTAPTLDSLDAATEDEITVVWTKNDASSDGEFEVWRSTDGSTFSRAADALSPSTTQYTDTGLNDGEKFWYFVRRVSSTGETSDSETSSAVTILPAPTGLSVSGITDTSADLSWSATHDYGDTRVDMKRSSATSWTTETTVSRATESYTLSGLLNGEEYDVRVVAQTEHTEAVDQ